MEVGKEKVAGKCRWGKRRMDGGGKRKEEGHTWGKIELGHTEKENGKGGARGQPGGNRELVYRVTRPCFVYLL